MAAANSIIGSHYQLLHKNFVDKFLMSMLTKRDLSEEEMELVEENYMWQIRLSENLIGNPLWLLKITLKILVQNSERKRMLRVIEAFTSRF